MEGLGINYTQIAFYLISFIIALFVLQKYVFAPVAKIMGEREESIRMALSERDESSTMMQNIQMQSDEILSKAKVEARRIVDEARMNAEPERKTVLENAEQERLRIIERAQNEAQDIISQAQNEADRNAMKVVESMISKALQNMSLDKDTTNSVMQQIIKNI